MDYYPRKIEEKMGKWLKRKEMILVKGPRQAGKTTLLQHLEEITGGKYLTLEDEELKNSFEVNPKEFVKRFMEGERSILLIDEAQYVRNVGRILKLVFDLFSERLKLIVTGSGSFDVKVEVGKHLVGRAVYLELFPLNFEEFLLWRARDLHKIFVDFRDQLMGFILTGEKIEMSPVFEGEFQSLLEEYIISGGFPAVVKEGDAEIKKELLKNLVRTYLEKDVFFFFGIRHLDKFRNFMNYLAFNTGAMLNISSIMREFSMDYRTVEGYLSVLQNTYLISLVSPYYRNHSTELKKSRKLYFTDTGLRNSMMGNFSPLNTRSDRGQLFENFIFNELKSNFERVNYWRTAGKAEVDFVLRVGQAVVPVEAKGGARVGRGFLSFIKSYKPARAVVFAAKEFGVRRMNGANVVVVPYFFI